MEIENKKIYFYWEDTQINNLWLTFPKELKVMEFI